MILLKKDDYKTSNKKIVIYSKNKNAIDKAEQKKSGTKCTPVYAKAVVIPLH